MYSRFLNDDFYLENEISKNLFYKYAKKMPIADYHCHINPMDIAENKQFTNLSQLWLNHDHYKWRLIRAYGAEEEYITGDKTDREKFSVWAKTIEKSIGNPIYLWSHLELKRYFDCDILLDEKSADYIYDFCREKIVDEKLTPKKIISKSNVKLICTTDDPIDTLEYHQEIKKDKDFFTKVLPTFRPDKAMMIRGKDYKIYIKKLGNVSKIKIDSFEGLKKAIEERLIYFIKNGCRLTDHGLEKIYFCKANEKEIENIFQKALNEKEITYEENEKFITAFMIFMGQICSKHDIIMQLHYDCLRNVNSNAFIKIGADSGFDCIGGIESPLSLIKFLDELEKNNYLPKTILYSLNPSNNAVIDVICGCFNGKVFSKIQHGCAWWFNDNKEGIENHIHSLTNRGLISGFVGMLTDSRSFLSYSRHEYFRRILCNYLGRLVEIGDIPFSDNLFKMVEDICYNNVISYLKI